MNKKNIFLFFLLALPAVLMTSCLKDQEDLFDKSSTARTNEYLARAKEVLMSSENGWVMNYYPDRNQSYGGFAYVLKFDEANVEARYIEGDTDTDSEGNTINLPVTSTYVMKNEGGPVMMFDTYNKYLHFYATPSGSSGAGGYEAYDGDFIFIIMGISEDENVITLKGNRSGNIMYMYRNTMSPDEYLNKVNFIMENMSYSSFTVGDLNITLDADELQATVTAGEETVNTAFVFTDKGVKFYEPVSIGSYELDDFVYDLETESLASADTPSLVMQGALPEGWKSFEELAGRYLVGSKTVTVKANADGQTYTITGLSSIASASITAEYKYATGSLVIKTPCYTGIYGGAYSCYLIATDGSYVSWAPATFKGSNSKTGTLTITFKNRDWTTIIEGGFTTNEPSGDGWAGTLTEFSEPLTFIRLGN